jgi:hypothetical protein
LSFLFSLGAAQFAPLIAYYGLQLLRDRAARPAIGLKPPH